MCLSPASEFTSSSPLYQVMFPEAGTGEQVIYQRCDPQEKSSKRGGSRIEKRKEQRDRIQIPVRSRLCLTHRDSGLTCLDARGFDPLFLKKDGSKRHNLPGEKAQVNRGNSPEKEGSQHSQHLEDGYPGQIKCIQARCQRICTTSSKTDCKSNYFSLALQPIL